MSAFNKLAFDLQAYQHLRSAGLKLFFSLFLGRASTMKASGLDYAGDVRKKEVKFPLPESFC